MTQADVLHIDPDAPGVTFVGDLADGSMLPDATFDCIVLTQTLHLIFDHMAALRTLERILVPGGVLLLTVPGHLQHRRPTSGARRGTTRSPTTPCARRATSVFGAGRATIESHGNVLAAVAFLHGLGHQELTTAELDEQHVEYSIVNAARVVKAGPLSARVRSRRAATRRTSARRRRVGAAEAPGGPRRGGAASATPS